MNQSKKVESIKEKVVNKVALMIIDQLEQLEMEIESVLSEMGNETKSSAGDKFETAREMMGQERNRLEERKAHLNYQLQTIRKIEKVGKSEEVQFGSFVETDILVFMFGIAIGKVELGKENYMLLSLSSPIGKAFLGKKKEDKVQFMNKQYQIINIQ